MKFDKTLITLVIFVLLSSCNIKMPVVGKLPPRETLIKYCWQTFEFGLKDKNEFVRTNTIRTLGRIGNRTAIDALGSFDYGWKPVAVKTCALTLAQIHDSAAFYSLRHFADSKDFMIREYVVVGIARMSDLFPDTMVVRYLKKMMYSVDSIAVDTLLYDSTEIAQDKSELRAKIGMALLKVGDRSGEAYTKSLARNRSLQFRISIAKVIGEINPPNSLDLLLPFLKDSSSYVRSKALESLIKIKPNDIESRLRHILASDKAEDMQVHAAIGLMKYDEWTSVNLLLKLLDSGDEDVLSRIILALGEVKSKPARDKVIPLLRSLTTQPSDWVRISSVASLGNLKDYESIDIIESALHDPSQEVREISVGVLSRLKGKLMLEDLKQLVTDDTYSMRSVAISGLGSIDDEALQNEVILPLLLDRLKNDAELIVRVRAAFTILDVLSGGKYTKQNDTITD
ncbi:HEAT repeat domain-containing protein [bacterium]|nr:HEAT repeat domain-containing protein [bacterium]